MSRDLAHPSPPFNAWLWLNAWQDAWWAALVPAVAQSQRTRRLARLLQCARSGSPFYATRLRQVHSLQDAPPVEKGELMQQFDAWATDRRITRAAVEAFLARSDTLADGFLGDYLLWTSSGTSGVQGWFVQDAAALAAYDAIDALRLRGFAPLQPALGVWGLGQRFAFVGASGGHFAGVVSFTRLARVAPAAVQPAISLLSVQQPLRQVAAELARFAPTVLVTYPSVAEALADLQRTERLDLPLAEIWVGGEQLSPARRRAVQQGFGCIVRNCYGASECLSIAFECSAGRLHLHEDWVIVEPVDEHLRAVPPGVLSHAALITNLANVVQPIIRYRLDDRVRIVPGACACGSHFTCIEVHGRSGDTLQLPGIRGLAVPIVPIALETAIEEGAGVSQFQVIDRQGTRGHTLELRFEPTAGDARAAYARCRDAIERYLAEQGVARTRCSFSSEPPQRDARSGKLRRVRRASPELR